MKARPIDRATLAAFVVGVLLNGGNWIAIRYSNRELSPFWGAALQFAIASALLFGLIAVRRIPLVRGRALGSLLVYGVGRYFATFALIYWALVAVPAGMTSVIFATLPLWTLFLAAAAGFERLRARNVLGALVAVAGLALIFGGELTADLPLERAVAVLAAAFFGGATAIIVRAFPRTHPVVTNAIGTAVGTPFLLIASRTLSEQWVMPHEAATLLAVGYLVLSTAIGFVLLTHVILTWSASAAAYGAVLGPIVTVVVAALLGEETFGLGFFIGAAVVGAGVYLGALSSATRMASPLAESAAD
jgi:drug/metabolite transporter (DMT)-like permease